MPYADAVVCSPPFSGTEQPCASQTRQLKDYHAFTRGDGTKRDATMTGQSPGQLGAMKPGTPEGIDMTTDVQWLDFHGCYDDSWDGLITPESFAHPAKMARGLVWRIFDFMMQQGWLKRGSTVIDPFGGIGTTGIEAAGRGIRAILCELEPKFVELGKANIELHRRTWEHFGDPIPVIRQGDSRRLCQVLGDVLGDALVSSPPYAEALNSPNHGIVDERRMRNTEDIQAANYGSSPGQLGAMRPGSVDAAVTSPPYEGSQNDKQHDSEYRQKFNAFKEAKYGPGHCKNKFDQDELRFEDLPGQLSNTTGTTFWDAAKEIVQQTYALLKPGGKAAWVCKDFIRKGKRVPFCDDWARLLESCGYRVFLRVKAWLVKEDRHPSLFGGEEVERTERKSFFRRLAEKKGSPSIDWEEVIMAEKPGGEPGGADALVTSPPYADKSINDHDTEENLSTLSKRICKGGKGHGEKFGPSIGQSYGQSPGQLGSMKPGKPPE